MVVLALFRVCWVLLVWVVPFWVGVAWLAVVVFSACYGMALLVLGDGL